jgi:hypothetical protein
MKKKAKPEPVPAIAPESTLSVLPPLNAPRDATNRRIPTAKQKQFAKVYAETLNATEAAAQAYHLEDNRKLAGVIGSENLAKPAIRAEIEALLKEHSISVADVLTTHRRNMLQQKHLPTSQKAVETSLELLGLLGTQKQSGSVNVAFIIERSD